MTSRVKDFPTKQPLQLKTNTTPKRRKATLLEIEEQSKGSLRTLQNLAQVHLKTKQSRAPLVDKLLKLGNIELRTAVFNFQ